jgi:hypothetical protein
MHELRTDDGWGSHMVVDLETGEARRTHDAASADGGLAKEELMVRVRGLLRDIGQRLFGKESIKK